LGEKKEFLLRDLVPDMDDDIGDNQDEEKVGPIFQILGSR
jgi:hypothetical protein